MFRRVLQQTTGHARRTMGTSTASKYFLVYAPDSATGDRFAVREQHLKEMRPNIDSGMVRIAGMTVNPENEDEPRGSMLIVEAPDLQTVKNLIEKDVYYKNRVWDTDKLTITGIRLATPLNNKVGQ